MISFADILSPVTEDVFFRDYLNKKPLHIQNSSDKFQSVMSWDHLSSLLNQTGIWSTKNLELALMGKRVDPVSYGIPGRDRDNRDNRLPDMKKVKELLRKGASLIANDIASLTPGLRAVGYALEDALNGKAQANLYCSWKAFPGFNSHYDTHEVFALHIAGEKEWKLYQRPTENPISHPAFTSFPQEFHDKNKGAISQTITLKPGDMLYIPRGWYHDALAMSGASLHVTFGVTQVIGLDAVSLLFEKAVHDPIFRRAVPSPQNGEALKQHMALLGEALSKHTQDPAFIEKFGEFIARYRYPRGEFSLPQDVLGFQP